MSEHDDLVIKLGLEKAMLPEAAALYLEGRKHHFKQYLASQERLSKFLVASFNEAFAVGASTQDGALLGFAELRTREGKFWDPRLRHKLRHLGPLGALSAVTADSWHFGLARSTIEDDVVGLDSILVRQDARHMRIGERLLDKVIDLSRQNHMRRIEVHLEDPTTKITRMYQSRGFVASDFNVLIYRKVYGARLNAFTSMTLDLSEKDA